MYHMLGQAEGSFPRVSSPEKVTTADLPSDHGSDEQQVRDASVGVIVGVGLLVFLVGYVALAERFA